MRVRPLSSLAVAATMLWLSVLPTVVLAQAEAIDKPDMEAHGEFDPDAPGPWRFAALAGLNLSQSGFSNNWAAGGTGSIGWLLKFDGKAERQVSTKFNTSTLLQLAYGQTDIQEPDPTDPTRKHWRGPEKTSDLVLLESVGRFTLHRIMDPYLAFRLDSQFLDDSDPAGKLVFNPTKLTETAGLARVFSKTEGSEFIGRVGFGFREMYGRTFADPTGDNVNSSWTTDGGVELQVHANQPLLDKRVFYQGKVLFFYPVFYSQSDALEEFDSLALASDPTREPVSDFWQTIDVNFQNTFTAQITKILTVDLYLQLIYDKFDSATKVDPSTPIDQAIAEVDGGIRKAGQFKQTLAIGFTFKML